MKLLFLFGSTAALSCDLAWKVSFHLGRPFKTVESWWESVGVNDDQIIVTASVCPRPLSIVDLLSIVEPDSKKDKKEGGWQDTLIPWLRKVVIKQQKYFQPNMNTNLVECNQFPGRTNKKLLFCLVSGYVWDVRDAMDKTLDFGWSEGFFVNIYDWRYAATLNPINKQHIFKGRCQ